MAQVYDGLESNRKSSSCFRYKINLRCAVAELHPEFRLEAAEFRALLGSLPGVTKTEWNSSKIKDINNEGNQWSDRIIRVWSMFLVIVGWSLR